MGIRVRDAFEAYQISTQNGAIGVFAPQILVDKQTGWLELEDILVILLLCIYR